VRKHVLQLGPASCPATALRRGSSSLRPAIPSRSQPVVTFKRRRAVSSLVGRSAARGARLSKAAVVSHVPGPCPLRLSALFRASRGLQGVMLQPWLAVAGCRRAVSPSRRLDVRGDASAGSGAQGRRKGHELVPELHGHEDARPQPREITACAPRCSPSRPRLVVVLLNLLPRASGPCRRWRPARSQHGR